MAGPLNRMRSRVRYALQFGSLGMLAVFLNKPQVLHTSASFALIMMFCAVRNWQSLQESPESPESQVVQTICNISQHFVVARLKCPILTDWSNFIAVHRKLHRRQHRRHSAMCWSSWEHASCVTRNFTVSLFILQPTMAYGYCFQCCCSSKFVAVIILVDCSTSFPTQKGIRGTNEKWPHKILLYIKNELLHFSRDENMIKIDLLKAIVAVAAAAKRFYINIHSICYQKLYATYMQKVPPNYSLNS